MEHASSVSTLANQSEYNNFSLVYDWQARSSEYSDAQLVLLGVAMAILVVAIVFGKLKKKIHFFQLLLGLFIYNLNVSSVKIHYLLPR